MLIFCTTACYIRMQLHRQCTLWSFLKQNGAVHLMQCCSFSKFWGTKDVYMLATLETIWCRWQCANLTKKCICTAGTCLQKTETQVLSSIRCHTQMLTFEVIACFSLHASPASIGSLNQTAVWSTSPNVSAAVCSIQPDLKPIRNKARDTHYCKGLHNIQSAH